jgi:hypothetical protein
MDPSMMRRFSEAGFQPIEVNARTVHPMVRLAIDVGDVVRVTWLGAGSPRVQGLSLRLRLPDVPRKRGEGGLLRVNDAESPTIVLWMDSAPQVVEAECVKLKEGAQLQISNRWRDESGREDEWLNNYGILIDDVGEESFVLHCSDGVGLEPTFDDLVVRIDIVRASHQRAS